MTYLNLEDFELCAESNDEIEDFGQDKRINDMTGNLNDTARHGGNFIPA
jgi:hypothetical protein